jgi:hypothetical protein
MPFVAFPRRSGQRSEGVRVSHVTCGPRMLVIHAHHEGTDKLTTHDEELSLPTSGVRHSPRVLCSEFRMLVLVSKSKY